MSETKEKILQSALALFAKDGYRAVSVSAVAGELGITKGALYKHYKNKRAIFESIVERMYEVDAEKSQEHGVPEAKYSVAPKTYKNISMKNVREFTMAQFAFWLEDDFASKFRRMLILEQYRDAEIAELYDNCLIGGPVAYMEDIFREMMSEGILQSCDPHELAIEYCAPFNLLLTAADCGDKDAATELAKQIELFEKRYIVNKEEN